MDKFDPNVCFVTFSVLGKEVIEMQVDDPTLFTSKIHKQNPWPLQDLYKEMGPNDNTVEFIKKKQEKLKQWVKERNISSNFALFGWCYNPLKHCSVITYLGLGVG